MTRFSCEISSVSRLKYPYRCIFCYFCFLVRVVLFIFMFSVLIHVAVISLSALFLCCHRVLIVLMHPRYLQCLWLLFLLLFLTNTACLYYHSKCKALCIAIRFLVDWFFCLTYSFVHFKNGPEYLTKGTAWVFIPLIRLLVQILVSRSISFVWDTLLLFFSSSLVWCHPFPIYSSSCKFPFLRAFRFILDSAVLFTCLFSLIISMAYLFMPNSIPISGLYILFVCIRVSKSSSFFSNSFMYIRWLIFSCDLVNL